jgi:hypothetical protein
VQQREVQCNQKNQQREVQSIRRINREKCNQTEPNQLNLTDTKTS